MVAGGIPQQEILRQVKAVGGVHRSGPLISGQGEQLHHLVVVQAEGIGEHFQGPPGKGFQAALVLDDLIHGKGSADGIQGGMVEPMAADFVTLINLSHFLRGNFGNIDVLSSGRPSDLLMPQHPGAQVEGAFQAILPEQLRQAAILHHAVVIAQCKSLALSAGEEQGIKSFAHRIKSFLKTMP